MFDQIEILLEGRDPHACAALDDAEVFAVRSTMAAGEEVLGAVRGREVGAGAVLWVLTDARVMALARGKRSVTQQVALSDLSEVDAQRGRYGATLALFVSGRRISLFAADPMLASHFMRALQAACPAPLTSTLKALRTSESAAASEWVAEARARLRPAAHSPAVNAVVMLREAAVLRDRGVLDAVEFGHLKGKLLAAA